jgi:hypothetical protein
LKWNFLLFTAVFTAGGFIKKSRFTEDRIVAILKEAEGGIANSFTMMSDF